MKKTIIVMPVANEEDTMEKILDEILALPYDNLYIYPVIDSYSKDRTEEIIRRKAACNDRVKCILQYRSCRVTFHSSFHAPGRASGGLWA